MLRFIVVSGFLLNLIGTVQAEDTIASKKQFDFSNTYQLLFSDYDKKIDAINAQYQQPDIALMQLNLLTAKGLPDNFDELGFLFAYRCFLEHSTKQIEQQAATLTNLKELVISSASHPSIIAAESFCQAWLALSQQNNDSYNINIEKAFNQVSQGQSATLTYWLAYAYASVALQTGRHNEAIKASQLALAIARANNDRYRESSILSVLALSEAELGFYDDALKHNQQAIDWYQSLNNESALLGLYQNRGYILNTQGKKEQAKEIYEHTITLATRLNNQYSIHSVYTNLAAIALSQGEYQQSNAYVDKILAYAKEHNYPHLIAYGQGIMAINFLYLGKLDAANQNFAEANKYFSEYKMIDQLADGYESWAEAMATIGKFEDAFIAHKKYKELSDQIFNSEREDSMFRVKELYDATQKNKEIEKLALENKQKSMALQNQSLQQKLWTLSAIATVLAMIVFSMMYRRLKTSHRSLKRHNKKLNQERFYDPLTGIYNRRFYELVQREQIISQPTKQFSLFVLDIDHFKQINDNYGHHCGDVVLTQFCQRLSATLREQDNLIRMGGEEFLLVVESHGIHGDVTLLQKLLNAINTAPFETDYGDLKVTMSVGVASHAGITSEKSLETALELADKALYSAKENGRNCGEVINFKDKDLALSMTKETLQCAIVMG